jgi:Tol biopolymer transport system component/DNA-binding winged helix-turn-helix (wHTH) protein
VRVEPHNFKIFKDGSEIQLEPKTFRLLLFLIENRTRLVEKSELLDAIWKDTFVTENALTREIAKLRKALGDDSKTPRYIQTVHTQGYRFIADVEETSETSSPENKKETENSVRQIKESPPDVPIPTATAQRKSSRQVFFLSLAALGILVALSLAAFFVWKSRQPKSETARNLKTAQITTWTSLDIYPAFSPDGNSIAYSSDHDGNFEIYVKPLTAGGRETQITSDGQQNFEPAFSPDGKFIAYYSKTSGGICIVPASGGKTKQITTFGSRPAWSPDGNSIAFQSDTITDLGAAASPAIPPSTIWIVSSHGGEPAQLTQAGNPAGGHGSPAWSPDGARIVFSASDFSGNSGSIWTVSGKGGDLRQLAQQASEPVFAPDGESVYYGSNLGLQKIRVSPSSGEPIGEPVQLMGNAPGRIRHFAVSADGKKIAYASLLITSNIWSVPVSPASNEATTEPAPLTQDRSFRKILPVFSPDGKRIAFQIRNVGGVSDIWLMDADGRNVAQITTEQANAPSWFPDGEQIAFLSGRQKHPQAWTTNLKTGQDKLLLDFGDDDVQYMRLSPEGKQIVFNSKKSGTTNVWTIQVEGGAAKQLTFDKELAGFACWSPDGKTLAFQIKRGDDTHVAIMPSDGGGEITQLTFDKGQSWASGFSPDGDKIAFAGFRNGVWNLYWVSLSTKQQKQLTNFAKLNSYVRYPAWSPLGNQIVYEYAETTGNIWIADLK